MKSRIEVCHLTPTYFSDDSIVGGGERYVYNLVKAVQCACAADGTEINQTVISVSENPRVFEHHGVKVQLLKNISSVGGNMNYIPFGLWGHLKNYDVVHIHQSLTMFGEYTAAVVASQDIPFVATDLGGGSSDLMLSYKGLELAERVLSISNYAHSLIQSSYTGNYDTVIGPVDTEFFVPPCSSTKRGSYGICVSRILPHKGIDRIISALPNGFHLKIVGRVYDESYFSLLKNMAKNKSVEFIHNADDRLLLKLYQGAAIFLQGSTHKDLYGNIIQKPELMGLTALEAMACGLPVIVSDAGSLPELVPNGNIGRTFGTHEDLISIFDDYMRLQWPVKGVNELARSYIVENYSFLSVGRKIADIYQKTAKAK